MLKLINEAKCCAECPFTEEVTGIQCYEGEHYCKLQAKKYPTVDISACFVKMDNKPEWCPVDKTNKILSVFDGDKEKLTKEIAKTLNIWDVFEENTGCKYCGRIPAFDSYGWFNDFDNRDTVATGAYSALYIGIDKDGRLIMQGSGDDSTEYYYPKYCPECGRKLV